VGNLVPVVGGLEFVPLGGGLVVAARTFLMLIPPLLGGLELLLLGAGLVVWARKF